MDCKKLKVVDRSNDVDSPSGVPVFFAVTTLAFGRITMGAGRIGGKTTLIDVNDGAFTYVLMPEHLCAKAQPLYRVGFRVK